MSKVNSEKYWDRRFKEDWDSKNGDEQSKFFMNLAFEMMPKWLHYLLTNDKVTICDWGCAEGDGTYLLAKRFSNAEVVGIDFAESAIKKAKRRYELSNLSYLSIDLLNEKYNNNFDIIFSSNVLEHFYQPWDIFKNISTFSNTIFMMLVPYNEDPDNLHDEHFHSFNKEQFAIKRDGWTLDTFRIKNTRELDPSYWQGQQILAVYYRDEKKDIIHNLKLRYGLGKIINDLNEVERRELLLLEDKIYDNQYRLQNHINKNSKIKPISNSKHLKEIALINKSKLFDNEYYLYFNNDVRLAGVDPLSHYLQFGYRENRRPSLLFDQDYYTSVYPDVRVSGINPLLHYLNFGIKENRICMPRLEDQDLVLRKNGVAFHLDSFDKGGLEEVVLSLAASSVISKNYNTYIFVTGQKGGHMQNMAEKSGIKVYNLDGNLHYLDYLIDNLNIKICNYHYSTFGLSVYKHHDVKLLYTIHNNYIWADEGFISERMTSYQRIDKFISVSSQVKDYFSNIFEITDSKIEVVPNGLDAHNMPSPKKVKRKDMGLMDDDYVFICVASFTPNKHHASLINAFSILKENAHKAKLVLVGNVIDLTYFNYLKDLIKEKELTSDVIIIDFMQKEELLGLFGIVDAFILTSLTEGFSIASLEAAYSSLPLILTDVGGARDLIEDDIGIIVPTAYSDITDLRGNFYEKYCYSDDSINIHDIFLAMQELAANKIAWKKKAQLGRKKITETFNTERVHNHYRSLFDQILYKQSLQLDLNKIINKSKIVFIAPYPLKSRLKEGWMSRINAVDQIIGKQPKIYINIVEGSRHLEINSVDNQSWEIAIGTKSVYFAHLFNLIINKKTKIYVHTLHLAEYVTPWLGEGNIVVDFHGITPEEEEMLGRPFYKKKYEDIEKKVLSNASACVMVTNSMRRHYNKKYPNIHPKNIIILPIVEDLKRLNKKTALPRDRYRIVYSGGTQKWQNVESMVKIAKNISNIADVTFLSHDWEEIQSIGESASLPSSTMYKFCNKNQLKKEYMSYEFGLVIRDDMPVNRVSCPTKLYEYMFSGIIPVVRESRLGDFEELGYSYVTEKDINNGVFPTKDKIKQMRELNYDVIAKMQKVFLRGSKNLTKLFIDTKHKDI